MNGDMFVAPRYPLWRGRSLALLAITVSALNLRLAVTSISPLLQSIGTEFGFGVGTIGIVGMLPPACFALFGTLSPVLMRRLGLERTAIAGLLLTAIGELVRAISGDTVTLIGLTIVALAGMGIAGVVIPPLVREYFSDRLPLVSTVYLIAMHLGALIPPLLAVPLAEAVGWRVTVGAWAVVALAGAGLWAATTIARSGHNEAEHGAQFEPQAVIVLPRHAWRSRTVWNLTILFGLTSFNVFILYTWLPKLLTDAGHSTAYAGAMVSLALCISMVIGIFAPTLTIRLKDPSPLVFTCVGLYSIGYAGLAMSPGKLAVLWVLFLGSASSLFIVATTMINTHSHTPAGSAVTSAFVQGIGGAIAILGPLLFGLLQEWTRSLVASYGLVAISLMIMAYAGARERQHGTIEDEVESTLPRSGAA
jgi:MFS transporter, CP family, cyanate transporter